MKRIMMITLTVIAVSTLLLWNSTAMAAKPDGSGDSQDVIARSNGFPSGEHFNLNIHGKDENFICDATPGGNSIFIDLYGEATIQYVTNKKSSVEELIALDPCATDDGTAKVQIPYEMQGYYVFGRILAKPGGKKLTPVSSIILYPNQVVEACNDSGLEPEEGVPGFPEYTDCSGDLALGLIVGSNLYTAQPETYVRFDPGTTSGKGRSKATDITPLFTYSGWVVSGDLDVNSDGKIDLADVPFGDYDDDTDTLDNQDYNNDTYVNEADVQAWLLVMQGLGFAWYFDQEWILNIADLVITSQGLENDGTKLLQVRFYPFDTTTFTPTTPTE